MKSFAPVYILLIAVLFSAHCNAHESRPLYVEIKERDTNVFSLMWKVPVTVAAYGIPQILMPEGCTALSASAGNKTIFQQIYRCDHDLSNANIGVYYPGFNPSVSTLFHFQRLSGEAHSAVLNPEQTEWIVPEKEQTWVVAKEYMVLGIKHILEGYDHLLFIACLMLLAGSYRRILITVTGFTIAHSITLALAALGIIQVSLAPVEACIALSIVFVAMELARDKRHTLTWRYPIAVSSTFGLLHGFGFAAVLTDIGLPQTEIPAALLFFNIGVELGQIIFVIVAIALFVSGKGLNKRLHAVTFSQVLLRIQRPAGYVVGTLAMFWTIDRVSGFWV